MLTSREVDKKAVLKNTPLTIADTDSKSRDLTKEVLESCQQSGIIFLESVTKFITETKCFEKKYIEDIPGLCLEMFIFNKLVNIIPNSQDILNEIYKHSLNKDIPWIFKLNLLMKAIEKLFSYYSDNTNNTKEKARENILTNSHHFVFFLSSEKDKECNDDEHKYLSSFVSLWKKKPFGFQEDFYEELKAYVKKYIDPKKQSVFDKLMIKYFNHYHRRLRSDEMQGKDYTFIKNALDKIKLMIEDLKSLPSFNTEEKSILEMLEKIKQKISYSTDIFNHSFEYVIEDIQKHYQIKLIFPIFTTLNTFVEKEKESRNAYQKKENDCLFFEKDKQSKSNNFEMNFRDELVEKLKIITLGDQERDFLIQLGNCMDSYWSNKSWGCDFPFPEKTFEEIISESFKKYHRTVNILGSDFSRKLSMIQITIDELVIEDYQLRSDEYHFSQEEEAFLSLHLDTNENHISMQALL